MNEEQSKTEETVQIVVFYLDVEEYAVSITDVREVVKVPEIIPVPNSVEFVAGVINLRGKVIPVLDLEKRFGLKRENEQEEKHIIVIDNPKTPFGVMVDEVSEVLRIPSSLVQDAPEAVNSKFGADFVTGVVVVADESDRESLAEDTGVADVAKLSRSRERLVLLLELRNIFSEDEGQQVVDASSVGTETEQG